MPLAHDNNPTRQISTDKSTCKYSLHLSCQSIFFQQSKTSISLKVSSSFSEWEKKKIPIFSVPKGKWGVELRKAPTLVGTEKKTNKKVPKSPSRFYGAEGICCPGTPRATNEAWHFNQTRRAVGKKSRWILARTL